jgi:predicted RNA polymerase sigma factor
MPVPPIEPLLRELTPRVLSALVRRYGDLALCEDAVQEALLAAALQWPKDGRPANPTGWLITAASRRRIELWRSDSARLRRERSVALLAPTDSGTAPAEDDTLTLFLLCAHPSLSRAAQVALTLRAVGGLTTAEIARAYLLPEATVAQRISRAKQRIRVSGAEFRLPPAAELPARISTLLEVLYMIFNEGHTASSGTRLTRVDLTREAIRLTRQVHAQRPGDGEVTGLLALMLMTDARRPARTDESGDLVPLSDQDRRRWDAGDIAEGIALITDALATTAVGPYQLQAAIAAVHSEARTASTTDWPQILSLYDLLITLAPGPIAALSRSVAVAMVLGPAAGLADLDAVESAAPPGNHRADAVRAHLLELSGDKEGARILYSRAARRTLNLPEQRYLEGRARACR